MDTSSLTAALFVSSERLGWEFVDPGEPSPSPLLQSFPLLHEPRPPLGAHTATHRSPPRASLSKVELTRRGWILGGVTAACALVAVFAPGVLLIPVVLGCFLFLPWLRAQMGTESPHEWWERERSAARWRYDQDYAAWRRAIADHDQRERTRILEANVWYPVGADSAADRIDVVGGVPDGWRHLLVTFGATVLSRRAPLLLLDMTRERIADGLMELAADVAVREFELPRDGQSVDLLIDLTADEVAEVMAEAVASLRGTPDPVLRAVDADVLRVVARRLGGNFTALRLAAGVRVLERTYEGTDLTGEEVTALTRQVDVVGSGEKVQDQLRFLRLALGFLSDTGEAKGAPSSLEDLWREGGLVVVATDDPSPTRKDFTERVLFQSLLHRMRNRDFDASGQVLVVVGADHLGAASLEAMAKQARSRGVRLVYFFEHLRDDTLRLLGTAHSASVLMRLGNAGEAAAAAEYIGRDYSFKLAQITRQMGVTDTVGGGENTGTSTTLGTTEQSGSGRSGFSHSSSRSTSVSESITKSSQQMSNWSRAESFTRGTTDQRVYEFDVEPRAIQSLPASAFVLVGGGAKRAVIADCNPAIAMLEGVADGRAVSTTTTGTWA